MPEAHLEFQAKDGAWYAGTASFEGPFLRVHFEHFLDAEDERWLPTKFKTLKDVKKVIRPTSQPMQDSQCGNLRPGVFLCVACRQADTDCFEYYDAKLEEILRSPHTYEPNGQECCMCKFEVEWLGGPLVHKRQFVNCGDICLRVHGDIEDDPVIKGYLAEVKYTKVLKSKAVSKKMTMLTSKKRKAMSSDDETSEQGSSADFMQSMSASEHIHSGSELHCGKRDYGLKKDESLEGQPLKKILVSTQCSETCEPHSASKSLSDINQTGKETMNAVYIDSDKEEDCKPSSTVSHNQIGALNDAFAKGIDCYERDHGAMSHKASSSVGDGFLTQEDSSRIKKEHMHACSGDVTGSAYVSLPRQGQKSEPCQDGPLGFIPIDPFRLSNMGTHSIHTLKNKNAAANRIGNKCSHSAMPHSFSHHACFDGKSLHVHGCEAHCNIKKTFWSYMLRTEEQLHQLAKGLHCTPFLLAENIEKDVIPSKAMKVIRKVTCDALMLYVWPSLDYETTRKAYICYQDFVAARAALQKFSAENLFVVSSKGRPWVISQACLHRVDWFQMLSFSDALALGEEDIEDGEETEDNYLLISYKGTEEYTTTRGKFKLFLEQQKKLRLCFQKFGMEEEELERLT